MRTAGVLVQQHAEREHVGARVDRLSVDLFRRHIRRRADDHAGLGHVCDRVRSAWRACADAVAWFDNARETEVEDLQAAVTRAHHVFGFEIAVDDAAAVRLGERGRQLARGRNDVLRGRPGARLDLLAQRVTVDELGHDVQLAADFLERVHGADARMRQRRGGARLAAQSLAMRVARQQMGNERLQRDRTIETRIRGQVDATHPAAADFAHDPVRPDGGARRQRFVAEQLRDRLGDRPREKTARAVVMLEQRHDFAKHDGIVGHFARNPRPCLGQVAVHDGVEHVAHAAMLFRCHVTARTRRARSSRRNGRSRSLVSTQFTKQPRARKRPAPLDRRRRHAERIARFFDAQPGEESQLDDARQLGVDLFETFERFVDRRQDRFLVCRERERFAERHAVQAGPPLLGPARPRTLDENLPHRSRRDADEMLLVGPRRAGSGKTQIDLVHERGRLQRLTRTLASHVGCGDAAQLVVHERRELLGARAVTPRRRSG
jgi:hypothetical protein